MAGALLLTGCSGPTGRTSETRAATAAGPGAPALTGALPTTAPSDPGGPRPVLGAAGRPGTRGIGAARPTLIDLGGTGATGVVRDVSWQDWGGPHATGTGTAGYSAPGAPPSAATPQPTTLVASDLGDCNGRLSYRVLTWYFPQHGEVPGARPPLDVCRG
ncbi:MULTISPECIES: hypothetical protein [Pseudonocardia]|nr:MULTISPECIES: hypothetical protein [Pseudonocardia]